MRWNTQCFRSIEVPVFPSPGVLPFSTDLRLSPDAFDLTSILERTLFSIGAAAGCSVGIEVDRGVVVCAI